MLLEDKKKGNHLLRSSKKNTLNQSQTRLNQSHKYEQKKHLPTELKVESKMGDVLK